MLYTILSVICKNENEGEERETSATFRHLRNYGYSLLHFNKLVGYSPLQ